MSLNYNGVVVENKARYVNEQGGSKLTYNFVTDPRLKRGHNFGIIYVTSSNYDENTGTGTSQQRKNIQSDKNKVRNFRGKNYLIQSKEKEEQDKKRNDKEGECGVCTTKVTTTVRPTPITFEEMVQTDSI